MAIITVESSYGPMDFEIAGDTPTPNENFKIRDIISNASQFNQSTGESTQESMQSSGPEFDRTTGIQDAGLRAGLSISDNSEEREAVLQKNGLTVEDYTKDSGGQLALTPSGAKKFGIETDKNIIIDESGFTKSDS